MIIDTLLGQIKRFTVHAQHAIKEKLSKRQKHIAVANGNQTIVHLQFGKKWPKRKLRKLM